MSIALCLLGFATVSGSTPGRDHLEAIRTAFLSNDAARVRACFAADQHVLISLPALHTDGLLGPGSLRAFVDRLARDFVTVTFAVVPGPTSPPADARRTYARVRWVLRERASGTLLQTDVYLSLHRPPEGPEWRIVEMRASW